VFIAKPIRKFKGEILQLGDFQFFVGPSFKVFKESEVVLSKVFICVCEFKDEVL
jgi:hypothetical protein